MLKDPEFFPDDKVLAQALGKNYSVYKTFIEKLPDFGIETQWRYYNDGKAWLAKNIYKKKTVFWLSVWKGFFKVSMFFTEKTRTGIQELPISKNIKTSILNASAMGKLFPLVMDISSKTTLNNLYMLIDYKQNLK